MNGDTDPDLKTQPTRQRPVVSVNLSWRQVAILVGVVGTPPGYLFARNRDVEKKADTAAVQASATIATAGTAQVQQAAAFELYRTEQLADRKKLDELVDAQAAVVEDMKIMKAALVRALPRERKKLTARSAPKPVASEPRPPLPATPAAAAATVPVPAANPPPEQTKGQPP